MSTNAKDLVKDLPARIGRIDNGMMRPVLPILLLCAACGDNLIVESEEEGPPVEEFPETERVAFAPDVCAVRAWPSMSFADRDVDLTVVPTVNGGAAVFTVDRAGGPLRGFAIDGRGELLTKEEGNTIRDDLAFTAVSAAYIDERLITAAVADDGSIAIDMIRPDLGAHHNLIMARGTLIADLPIAHARDARLVTVGDTNGLTAIRFNNAWQTNGTQPIGNVNALSMTSTRYRDDTMIAWSTDSTCTLSRVAAEVTSTHDFACIGGRLAMNVPEHTGYIVYEEGGDKLSISQITITDQNKITNQRVLVDGARSPKILFDGSRYWVSYINIRQDVVVGYVGPDGSLVSMALEGTQPYGEGYELALVNGGVWVFSVDGAGVNAQRLCLKPVR